MDLLLECEICKDKFDHNDHRPRFLNCGHSLCSQCIGRSLETNEGKLKCPFCRSSTELASDQISNLPENFTLLKMIDAEEQKQKSPVSEILETSPIPVKETSSNQPESDLEILRQIEIDGSLAFTTTCNDRLEDLKNKSKELKLEKDALDDKLKELMMEKEKIENRKIKINSEIRVHEVNVSETMDLIQKVEASLEFIRTAKSGFGLKMAAQDITACKGIIQDWEKETMSYPEKTNEDSSSEAKVNSKPKIKSSQEKFGSTFTFGGPSCSITTSSTTSLFGSKGNSIFSAAKTTKFGLVGSSSGFTFGGPSCSIATSSTTSFFGSKGNSFSSEAKTNKGGLFGSVAAATITTAPDPSNCLRLECSSQSTTQSDNNQLTPLLSEAIKKGSGNTFVAPSCSTETSSTSSLVGSIVNSVDYEKGTSTSTDSGLGGINTIGESVAEVSSLVTEGVGGTKNKQTGSLVEEKSSECVVTTETVDGSVLDKSAASAYATKENITGSLKETSEHVFDITSDISEFVKIKVLLNESSFIKLPNNVIITKENVAIFTEIFSFQISNPERIQVDLNAFDEDMNMTEITNLLKILNDKKVSFEINLPNLLHITDDNVIFYADIFCNNTSSVTAIDLNIKKDFKDSGKFTSLINAISVKNCEIHLFLQQQWRLNKPDTSDEIVTSLSKTCSLIRFKGRVQNLSILPNSLRELSLSLGPNVDLATLPSLHQLKNLKRLDICIDEHTNASSLSPLPMVNPSLNLGRGNTYLYLPRVSDCQDWPVNVAKNIQPEKIIWRVLFPESTLTPRGVEWLVQKLAEAKVRVFWIRVSSPKVNSCHNGQLRRFTQETSDGKMNYEPYYKMEDW